LQNKNGVLLPLKKTEWMPKNLRVGVIKKFTEMKIKIALSKIMPLFLLVIFSACTSNSKKILSFAETDLGISNSSKLLMNDESKAKEYLASVSKEYKSELNGSKLLAEISKEVTVSINYSLVGNKVVSVDYTFASNDEINDDISDDFNKKLANEYNTDKHSKKDSLIIYSINKEKTKVTVRFEYEYGEKSEVLKTIVNNSIKSISDTSSFILTHYDGTQVIPENKIWILKELHRCISDAPKPDSSALSTGTTYHCDWVTRNNRIMYFDLIINNKCMALDGNKISDAGWKKYPGYDVSAVYDDPTVYIKLKLNPSIVLFPGMSICINTPDNVSRRLLVQELDVNDVKGLQDYIDFKSAFGYDAKSFEYVDFMNLVYWSYRE